MLTDEKRAPVQGYSAGIPWSLHLRAYDAYCKAHGPQPAMIDLEGRNCRGGFGVGELDVFIPGWRDELSEIARLKAEIERLEKLIYVPGQWRCAKCNFRLTQSNLYVASGTVGPRDEAGDKCPNCQGPLWRVSAMEDRTEAYKTANDMFDRLEAALPSPVERESIEYMRGDLEGSRHIKASDAEAVLHYIGRISRLIKPTGGSDA